MAKRKPKPTSPPAETTPTSTTEPKTDPFVVPTQERETSNPATEEPNPLNPKTATTQPPTQDEPSQPDEESPSPRAEPGQGRGTTALALEVLRRFLKSKEPPTVEEVETLSSALERGLPAWVFSWPTEALGAVLIFTLKRWPERKEKAEQPAL